MSCSAFTSSSPQMPVLRVPTAKRTIMPSALPAKNATSTPLTECQDSITISAAVAYRMFHPHFTDDRMRRGPAVVRKAAMAV